MLKQRNNNLKKKKKNHQITLSCSACPRGKHVYKEMFYKSLILIKNKVILKILPHVEGESTNADVRFVHITNTELIKRKKNVYRNNT